MGLYIDPFQGDAAKEMFRLTVEEAMASGQVALAGKLLAMSASFAETADYGQTLLDATATAAKDAAQEAAAAATSWTGLGKVLAMFSGLSAEVQQKLWPTEEFELAKTRVATSLPEDDLFAGITPDKK